MPDKKPHLEVHNLSKSFRINHQIGGYLSLRDQISGLFVKGKMQSEEFYALKDIGFEVSEGDSLGIIGRNGAGKSTLLKILSRITPPTKGRIVVRGRIASLLEVGTGFHQELTGRENIFFNGSLLGMKRKEVQSKFDAIVDFSGTERFLDTPLKHYSSGMQLRLAFSVAAFLEPEIMIIDEVLAVGDAEFQRKCMGKMQDVSQSGRTILFVSHDLDAVERLCRKAILLQQGSIASQGMAGEVIQKYLASGGSVPPGSWPLAGGMLLKALSFADNSILSGDVLPFEIELHNTNDEKPDLTDLCLLFYNYKKQRVAIYDLRNFFGNFQWTGNRISYRGVIQRFNLVEGEYQVGLFYGIDGKHGDLYEVVKLQVKRRPDQFKVNPYDLQYRGFVDLM